MNTENMDKNTLVIAQTKAWIQSVIIKSNFCPFAKKEFSDGKIHYRVDRSTIVAPCLEILISECMYLDKSPDIETTFIVYPDFLLDFSDFLAFVELSEAILIKQGYEGIFQLANFHPEYCFAGENTDDPANYTNRFLYPMLHVIRESSIERVLKSYRRPENIPKRNMQYARDKGNKKMKAMLDACKNPKM